MVADLGVTGNQAFRFVGAAELTETGQVRVTEPDANGTRFVEADVDGSRADWRILLAANQTGLGLDNFVL